MLASLLIVCLSLPAEELAGLRAQLSAQPLDRREAAEALAHAGPEGLEQLLAALHAGESDRRVLLESIALAGPQPPVIEAIGAALRAEAVEVRAAGASAAAVLGEHALPFVEQLRGLLQVPGAEADAAAALADLIDPVNVPALGALVTHADPAVRGAALDALANHGRYAAPQIAGIRATLRGDAHPEVRALAARCLGRIGSAHALVVSDLAVAAVEPQVEVRLAARRALGMLGPRAEAARAALVAGLADLEDEDARAMAAWALGRLGAAARPALPQLIQAAYDPSVAVVEQAIFAVARTGDSAAIDAASDHPQQREKMLAALASRRDPPRPLPNAVRISLTSVVLEFRLAAMRIMRPYADPEALPTLIARLSDSDARNRKAAALALSAYGQGAGAALVPLVQMLQDDVPAVAEAATEAVIAIGPAALPHLKRVLAQPRAKGRAWAALAVGRLGGQEARGALRTARMAPDPRLRVAGLAALFALDPADTDALQGLVAALTGSDGIARWQAAHAIAPLEKPPALLDGLIAALDAPEVAARVAVVDALARTRDPRAGRALRRALRDLEEAVRIAAVEALPRFPAAAQAAVRDIAGVLDDPDPRAGEIAARALGAMGEAARPTISRLIRVDDRDVDRLVAATDALFAIAGEPAVGPQVAWAGPAIPAPAAAESAADEAAAVESAGPASAPDAAPPSLAPAPASVTSDAPASTESDAPASAGSDAPASAAPASTVSPKAPGSTPGDTPPPAGGSPASAAAPNSPPAD